MHFTILVFIPFSLSLVVIYQQMQNYIYVKIVCFLFNQLTFIQIYDNAYPFCLHCFHVHLHLNTILHLNFLHAYPAESSRKFYHNILVCLNFNNLLLYYQPFYIFEEWKNAYFTRFDSKIFILNQLFQLQSSFSSTSQKVSFHS